MPRVFVTHENPALNYQPAEDFGDVEFLTNQDLSPMHNSLNNEAIIENMRKSLTRFDPKNDYIVLSGSPVVTAVAFMLLRERTDTLNVLRWSNRDHVYQHILVSVKQR